VAHTGVCLVHRAEIMQLQGAWEAALEEARSACRELENISRAHQSDMLRAMSAQAHGALALAEGESHRALVAFREALRAWQELEAPYEAARVRVLVALACRVTGDEDTATWELAAARGVFDQLGAVPDVSRVDSLSASAQAAAPHGLTQRELQVLRLVAGGATNRSIAAELVLSERTIDRHVSNIFAKLRVSSRAAATAYAYEHDLV
jgi:DNA-binding NarL/FixJ family response regulator